MAPRGHDRIGPHGAVSSTHHLGTAAAATVLARGGNAFDAAVAALAHFAVAGAKADEGASGPGSFAPQFLDALAAVAPEALSRAAIHDAAVPA